MLNRSFIIPSLLATTMLRPIGFDTPQLEAYYADNAEIPEAFRSLYVERDTSQGKRWELAVTINGVNGVKSFSDFAALAEALRKERNDHKSVRAVLQKFGNRSVDEILADLDRIPELEAAAQGGSDPKKIEKLVEARLNTVRAPLERERDQLKAQLGEYETRVKDFEATDRRRRIHDQIRDEATKLKLLPAAFEDAFALAERVFDLDDNGVALVKDDTGYGVGLNAAGWLKELQTKKAHWWGPSEGGGAAGNRGGAGGPIKNPWAKATLNLTEQGRITKEDPALAKRLEELANKK